jgi:hypothetical protein
MMQIIFGLLKDAGDSSLYYIKKNKNKNKKTIKHVGITEYFLLLLAYISVNIRLTCGNRSR